MSGKAQLPFPFRLYTTFAGIGKENPCPGRTGRWPAAASSTKKTNQAMGLTPIPRTWIFEAAYFQSPTPNRSFRCQTFFALPLETGSILPRLPQRRTRPAFLTPTRPKVCGSAGLPGDAESLTLTENAGSAGMRAICPGKRRRLKCKYESRSRTYENTEHPRGKSLCGGKAWNRNHHGSYRSRWLPHGRLSIGQYCF